MGEQSERDAIEDLGESILTEYMYEGMFLVDSNRYASDPEGTQQAVLGMLTRVGAKVVASRPWQEGKLCYPIEGQRKGLYYLACFTMDGGSMVMTDRTGMLGTDGRSMIVTMISVTGRTSITTSAC